MNGANFTASSREARRAKDGIITRTNKIVPIFQSALMLSVVVGVAFGIGPIGKNKPRADAAANLLIQMDQETQDGTPLPEGSWGGDGIRLNVAADSASILLACAEGSIPGRIYTDKAGGFSIDGTFKQILPGPERPEDKPVAANYSGSVAKDKMTLKITLKGDGRVAGEYALGRGKSVRIIRCL